MKPLTQLLLLAAGVYVVVRVMKGRKGDSVDESANFVNSTGDGGDWRYKDSPWTDSVNAAGKATCLCRGVKMPCSSGYYQQHCGQGGGRVVSR